MTDQQLIDRADDHLTYTWVHERGVVNLWHWVCACWFLLRLRLRYVGAA